MDMSFEQPTFSFTSGQPPTPTRTPTSDPADEQQNFQTPKLDSSFFDSHGAWENAGDSNSSGSFQKTPKAQTRELSAHAAHLLTTPNFALLSPQMPSPELPQVEARTGNMESMIQTPPPTNSSGTKRREKQNSSMRTPRPDGSSRQLLPKPVSPGLQTTSAASPQMQFGFDFGSPNLFGAANFGPATAPVYPQQKPFWEDGTGELNMDFATGGLLGASKQNEGLEPFVSTHAPASVEQSFIDFPGGLMDNTVDPNISQGMMDGQMHNLGGGVDPSLLFSSPTSRNAGDIASNQMNNEALQPYAYQLQEARREKAYSGVSKAKRRRKPSVDSPAVVAALESLRDPKRRSGSSGEGGSTSTSTSASTNTNINKPGLRRSMTDSFVPRSGRSSSSSSRAGTSRGRLSPLKQVRADAKKRHRASGRLVIDSEGRARLETVLHQSSDAGGDADTNSATYSSDSESTEADEEDDGGYGALTTSFGGDVGSGGMHKYGKYNASPSHSHKSSYSSYYSSNSDQSKPKTKPTTSKRASRHVNLDPVKEGGSFEDDLKVSMGAGSGREVDSAQQALMHSMKASQRGRYSPQKQNVGLEPFVSSPSTATETGWATPNSTESGRKSNYR